MGVQVPLRAPVKMQVLVIFALSEAYPKKPLVALLVALCSCIMYCAEYAA